MPDKPAPEVWARLPPFFSSAGSLSNGCEPLEPAPALNLEQLNGRSDRHYNRYNHIHLLINTIIKDTVVSINIYGGFMGRISLLSSADVQQQLADTVREKRKALRLSRDALAERSTVPAPTIKKFELTGQISLRQFLLLWQSVDTLETLAAVCQPSRPQPRSIDEVLKS